MPPLTLAVQGMCINARADPNATHVPFRDSKLTRLLQVGWGGVVWATQLPAMTFHQRNTRGFSVRL